MISSIISRLVILVFGTLYPAYASYKAVKSKNVREYVKWMMYWIVFAFFTCVETITDVFLSWFPFYYEIKIILVIWLLSPATKGSSFLYRKFVHPMLSNREQEIDEYITKAKEQSYKQVLDLGSKGVNALMQTALKSGGGLVNQIKKSYSLSDLTDRHTREEGIDETDVMITDTRLMRTKARQSPMRRGPTPPMYFSEIDVRTDAIVSVQSVEDISSSGYSSGEGLTNPGLKLQAREGLVRSGSIGGASGKTRPTRLTRSTVVPKKSSTTDGNARDRSSAADVIFFNDRVESIEGLRAVRPGEDSSSDGEFADTVESLSELDERAADRAGKSNTIYDDNDSHATADNEIDNRQTEMEEEIVVEEEEEEEEEVIIEVEEEEDEEEEVATEKDAVVVEERETVVVVVKEATGERDESERKQAAIKEIPSKQELPPESIPSESTPQQLLDKQVESLTTNVEPLTTNVVPLIPAVDSKESSPTSSDTEVQAFFDVPETSDTRGGKYRKKTAPEPPAITAKLVLKPGVVKTLENDVRVFCNSPKAQRRAKTRSRSPSPSHSHKKKESTMSKFMLLPQKMGGFLKHGSLVELRDAEGLSAARSTASLTDTSTGAKKSSLKQFFQRRK